MIVAKPKRNTLFSLGLFIALAVGMAVYITLLILKSDNPAWYQYVLTTLLYPIGIGLALKVIVGYKSVTIGKNKIEINYPVQFRKLQYDLKDITSWKETSVKTATGTYKEVAIQFNNKKTLNLSYQEHTDYSKVVQYLKKKCSRAQVK